MSKFSFEKFQEPLHHFSMCVGGVALGIASLRRNQYSYPYKIEAFDYFEASMFTFGGGVFSYLFPPFAAIFVAGAVMEELNLKKKD